jgi:uncharacterized membrane protein YbhN (UPF0104 family)
VRSSRILVALSSLVTGAALTVALIRIGRVDPGLALSALRTNRTALAELVLLHGLLVYLSTSKWLCIDGALRNAGEIAPSKISAFFVTSMGMALGLVLPVQLGLTVSRTLSIRFYGRALTRGAGGTIFEQGFDLIVVIYLAGASLLTWLCHGRGMMWIALAFIFMILALVVTGPLVRIVQHVVKRSDTLISRHKGDLPAHWQTCLINFCVTSLTGIRGSSLINLRLARRLVILSAARYFVLVLMTVQTANAVNSHIAFWQFGAAMPFATIANVLAITPGGIGLNELTSVTALHLFGVPLADASQWALANRILVTASCFAVVLSTSLMLGVERIVGLSSRLVHSAGEAEEV